MGILLAFANIRGGAATHLPGFQGNGKRPPLKTATSLFVGNCRQKGGGAVFCSHFPGCQFVTACAYKKKQKKGYIQLLVKNANDFCSAMDPAKPGNLSCEGSVNKNLLIDDIYRITKYNLIIIIFSF